jgi:DNA-binding SARP family transcriptional activator
VRALLYRLAASREPIPREQLCFLFWPDVPETASRRKLSGLLAHLRRTLPAPDLLLAQDDHIGLDPEQLWSDLISFETLCRGQPSRAEEAALQQAVDLYRGPFLDGFSLPDGPEYEGWMVVERGACERMYLEALATLIEKETTSGQYGAAVSHAQRYLETDDLAEEIHRQLIQLYTLAGSRSAALRQYEHCVAVLDRELGVEPLPETQAAHRAALESRGPAQPALVSQPDLGEEQEIQQTWTTRPGLDVELVGRKESLQQLAEAFARTQQGQGGILLIAGEPGIGKSRLMQEFATSLGEKALVLTGTGYPDTQASPYQPIVDAIRPALLVHHSRMDVPQWCHTEAYRLIPEIRPLHPELPPMTTLGSEQAQATLFEALYQLLLGLAAIGPPVLLCLDDLQWASGTTIDWLVYASRQFAQAARPRVLMLGAYRSEASSTMFALRQGLAREGILAELALKGLDEPEIRQLLKPLVDSIPGDQDLVSYLRQVTGGNPFFLLETVQSLIEAGCPPEILAEPESMCLPDSVLEAIEARVARLSPTARQVLEAGAVLGRSFSFALVHQTSGRGEMETVDGLDEVAARQLVEEGATGYWFRHEMIRAAVYRQLSRRRQEVLHRRAGEAMERLEPRNTAALARHFERAGEPGRAAPYALEAGRVAKEVFAHVEALACFDKALELLEWEAVDLQDPEALVANERLRVEVLFERGWALRLVGDMEAYARDGEEVVRLARSLGDSRSLAHMGWREAYAHRWFCRFAEARATAEEGVLLSQSTEDLLLEAMCRREVGLAARATGDYELARAELEQALDLFIGLGETVYEVHTMGNLATLFWYENDCDQAMGLASQALERCEAAGMHLEKRLPLGDMGAAAAGLNAIDLARRCLEESLSIARQAADRTQEILCLTHLGWLSIRIEQPVEALEHLQAGLALAQEIGSCTEQSWLRSGLAEALRLAGDRARATEHAQRALALAQATGAAYDLKLANQVLKKLEQG